MPPSLGARPAAGPRQGCHGALVGTSPTSLRHSPADSYVSEGGSSPPGVSVYFEDGFAVQPFTHTPCGVRGCGGVLQFVPRRFFGVRPPIMPLRLSEAEGGGFPALRFGFAPDRQHYRRTAGASRLRVLRVVIRPAITAGLCRTHCSLSLLAPLRGFVPDITPAMTVLRRQLMLPTTPRHGWSAAVFSPLAFLPCSVACLAGGSFVALFPAR